MADVNVTELRQRLPAYLSRVRRGERIQVTSRGKVIAEIAPPPPSTSDAAPARSRLRGTLVRYEGPTEPVFDPEEWDVNR